MQRKLNTKSTQYKCKVKVNNGKAKVDKPAIVSGFIIVDNARL